MRASRILPVVNLLGCLAITCIIVAQWLRELAKNERIREIRTELAESSALAEAESKRADALMSDVEQLKESIEATVAARREAEEAMSKAIAERDARLEETMKAAQSQLETWQKAIDERDEKIRQLNSDLVATRKRLNEAIAKLKEAGAR